MEKGAITHPEEQQMFLLNPFFLAVLVSQIKVMVDKCRINITIRDSPSHRDNRDNSVKYLQ
jgi:hypothetical protein